MSVKAKVAIWDPCPSTTRVEKDRILRTDCDAIAASDASALVHYRFLSAVGYFDRFDCVEAAGTLTQAAVHALWIGRSDFERAKST